MVTQYFNVNAVPSAIDVAANVIRQGGLVAFPTETVYGLGADATDANAVARIYVAKQRALNDPLIVHCTPPDGGHADGMIEALLFARIAGELTALQRERATALAAQFWPGPLTMVLPRGARIPPNATAGLDTVAVRMPNHPVALALIRKAGVPIAAPSANRFGHVSPTTAQHVLDDLDGRIELLLDGGPATIGLESTVLDLCAETPAVLRPGGLAREAIERVIGPCMAGTPGHSRAGGDATAQPAPGMLSKHYAPRAELRVVRDTAELLHARAEGLGRGRRVGLLITGAQQTTAAGLDPQYVLGDTLDDMARHLYAGLRALDAAGVSLILVSDVERTGLGEAIADRLSRAAAGR